VPTPASQLTILENDREFARSLPMYTVVGASAGSGKTRALKQRFIQLLLSTSIPGNSLRNILAITFTNNAAREMKQRVLDALKSASLGTPGTIEELQAILVMTPAELQLEADRRIDDILDNYSDFQILTIDSFLSRVFKASALELGLPPDLQIVLDSDALLDEAFDLFARELREGTDSAKLLRDLLDLLGENLEADDRFIWNPHPYLSEMVKGLYKRIVLTSRELTREDFSAEIKSTSADLIRLVLQIDALTNREGLIRADRFETYLTCAKAGDVDSLVRLKLPSSPAKKTGSKPALYAQATADCQPLCDDAARLRQRLIYLKARQYYQPYAEAHALLSRWIESVKREKSQVDIGDVVKRLAAYLKPGIVPEVYYSLGDTLSHYLIDEFQDTNPIQWDTLEPLVGNALSTAGSLFVVGDTKQSIYGFRGADWKIMRRLQTEQIFPSARKDLKTLETNYRSHEQILRFNEDVFQKGVPPRVVPGAAEASGLATDRQAVRGDFAGKGYVQLVTVTPDEADEDPQAPAQKLQVLQIVNDCIARGYRRSDITILSPRNSDIIEISSWLNEKNIPFISHSSLDVRSRKITGELLALLKFLDSPIDDLSFATFLLGDIFAALLRETRLSPDRNQLLDFLFTHRLQHRRDHSLYVRFRQAYPELWAGVFEELYTVVGYLPVYDLVSEIFKTFRLFSIIPGEEASLVKILEVVKDFEEEGENSLKAFLRFAETPSEDADWNIDIPADADAVRVMTIHKAKGLESKVTVVLLYDAQPRRDGLHLDDDGENVRLIHVTKSDAEESPDLMELYEKKELSHVVDDLNKLYVALTRAEYEMYVISVKARRGKTPSEFLPEQGYGPGDKPTVKQETVLVRDAAALSHELPHVSLRPTEYDSIALREIRRGEFVHAVLESIEYVDASIDDQLDQAFTRARLQIPFEGDEVSLRSMLRSALTSVDLQPYFERIEGRRVLNEQEFVMADGSLMRMDRVVVDPDIVTVLDYKTGDEKPGYTEQVAKYMVILRDFYKTSEIRGFLVYIDRSLIRSIP